MARREGSVGVTQANRIGVEREFGGRASAYNLGRRELKEKKILQGKKKQGGVSDRPRKPSIGPRDYSEHPDALTNSRNETIWTHQLFGKV